MEGSNLTKKMTKCNEDFIQAGFSSCNLHAGEDLSPRLHRELLAFPTRLYPTHLQNWPFHCLMFYSSQIPETDFFHHGHFILAITCESVNKDLLENYNSHVEENVYDSPNDDNRVYY